MAFVDITEFQSCVVNHIWTIAFKKAIESLSRCCGGTLYVPAGNYRTGSIILKDHITLYLESGAQLIFDDDPEQYPPIVISFLEKDVSMYHPFLYAKGAANISIIGKGTLIGQGSAWWAAKTHFAAQGIERPHMICLEDCTDVEIRGISCIDPPAWAIHPLRCNGVLIDNVSIHAPADSPNTHGIDPNCSSNVTIANCVIDVGDDCIAIKAGIANSDSHYICENILISNCTMLHGHSGVAFSCRTYGIVQNVAVSNCIFHNTDRGIRLKTRRRQGGCIQRLSFQNIIMDHVISPFVANMYYNCGNGGKAPYVWDKNPHPVDITTPQFQDIQIDHVTAYDTHATAGFFYGLPESPIRNLSLSHCTIYMAENAEAEIPAMMDQIEPMKQAGIFLRNVEQLKLHEVRLYHTLGGDYDLDASVIRCS